MNRKNKNRYQKLNHFFIASSLVLLAILFCSHDVFAQAPKFFVKCTEKQNRVQSGYAKLQETTMHYYNDDETDDDTSHRSVEVFFIITPQDLKYLVYENDSYNSYTYCKSAYSEAKLSTGN